MKGLTQKMIELYYDGELSPGKAREVEELIERSPEWRESLERVALLGDLLREAGEETASNASLDGFVERVSERIKLEKEPGVLERSLVWLGEFKRNKKTIWVPTAVAAAAAVALILAIPLAPDAPVDRMRDSGGSKNEIWLASGSTPSTSEIESVDFGEGSGSVYQLGDGHGGKNGVVWIVEGR